MPLLRMILAFICAIEPGCRVAAARFEPALPPTAATGGARAAPSSEVSVVALGAVPDDDGDDTSAIQAALDTRQPVFFPAGHYLVTRELNVSGTFHIRGPGATISTSASSASLLVAKGDITQFSIRDVTLKTTRRDLVARGGALLYMDYHSVRDGTIDGASFDTGSSFSNGILIAAQKLNTVSNITIRRCRFSGPSAAIEIVQHVDDVQRISDVTIADNTMLHNGRMDDQQAGFGISLSGPHRNVSIFRNDIRRYPYAGIEVVAKDDFVANYRISDNTLIDCGRGLLVDARLPRTRVGHVSITRNTILNNRFFQRFMYLVDSEIIDNRIELTSSGTLADRQPEFVSFRHSDRVTVADNDITVDLPRDENNKAVVTFIQFRDSSVSGNHIRTSGSSVLRLDMASSAIANRANDNTLVHLRAAPHDPIISTDPGPPPHLPH